MIEELWIHIIRYLKAHHLPKLAATCKEFRDIIENRDEVWSHRASIVVLSKTSVYRNLGIQCAVFAESHHIYASSIYRDVMPVVQSKGSPYRAMAKTIVSFVRDIKTKHTAGLVLVRMGHSLRWLEMGSWGLNPNQYDWCIPFATREDINGFHPIPAPGDCVPILDFIKLKRPY